MRRRGDIAEALSTAAAQGPASVTQLAARAQVGKAAAKYTASRMVGRGELEVVQPGRPAVLGLPVPEALADHLAELHSRFWVFSGFSAD